MGRTDVTSFVKKHLDEYARGFVKTLVHPIASFQPLQVTPVTTIPEKTRAVSVSPGSGSRPQLIAFVLMSLILGSAVNSFVPARKYSGPVADDFFVFSILWINVAVYMNILCLFLRGKANIAHALWVMLQVFATTYVVSSFINLVGGVVVLHPAVSSLLVSAGRLGDSIANNSKYIYFLAQLALLHMYLPLAVKAIHGFGWIRTAVIASVFFLFWVAFWRFFSFRFVMY